MIAAVVIGLVDAKDDVQRPALGCTVAAASDNLVGMTTFMGNRNITDSIWHDELPHFRQHGPLSKLTLYRAFFYDGIWHDPGELKGMQFWYGPKQQPPIYTYLDGDANLFGARKPHLPQEFTLAPDELITKVELQWDPISMRYAVFTTNKGRALSWGFKDVAGATTAVAEAPVKGAYLAAIRGFEGKPAPVSKKRYILQVSLVWAVPSCKPAGSPVGGSIALEAARLDSSESAQGPTNVYLWDKETVALLPPGIEAANVVYDGMTITAPAAGTAVPTMPAPVQALAPVPTIPAPAPVAAPVPAPAPARVEAQAAISVPTIPIAVPKPTPQSGTATRAGATGAAVVVPGARVAAVKDTA